MNIEKRYPTPVGEIVKSILGQFGNEQCEVHMKIASAWNSAVGVEVSQHTKPVEMKKGLLMVHVDSSVWFNELSRYYKGAIIEKLNAVIGNKKIKDIKFKIGKT